MKAKVYFSEQITPEKVVELYKAVGLELPGKVAVKVHSGEPGNQNFLTPEFWQPMVEAVHGTIVECNTAYPGERNTTDAHRRTMIKHGWSKLFDVDILDAEGPDLELPIPNGKRIQKNLVGKNIKNYDSMLVLSHFKGHPMGGFGGALKQLSIGCASSAGKANIHGAGKPEEMWTTEQNAFLESMADAAESVVKLFDGKIVYINVMKNMSVDCDCCAVAEDPCMKDIGILASLDPIAIDQACLDLVYASDDPGRDHLVERIESLNGVHTVEAAAELVHGVGGLLIAQNRLSAVDMATFALYISLFSSPIQTLVDSTESFQKAIAGFKRMDEVLATMPDVQDAPDARPLEVTDGAIEYRDVCFSYKDVELGGREPGRPVIDHLNLSIRPGETIALVGPSGGGKSTTCSLLPRFYDIDAGSITIDGQDVSRVTQESLRRAIGLVQQDVYLFDGTIRENIAYGRPDATDAEIEEAARRANIHEFIESLDEGYDTVVGERGGRLSGGQKQRVAIARVFLKDPAILILDEATSALDTESERLVQEALENLMRNRTTIVIAHRLSTIRNADEICVMHEGEIVERGRHEELIALDGYYKRLCDMQSF